MKEQFYFVGHGFCCATVGLLCAVINCAILLYAWQILSSRRLSLCLKLHLHEVVIMVVP